MNRIGRARRAAERAAANARGLGAPTSLREIGRPEAGLDEAADLAAASPRWNPRPIEKGAVRALLDDARHGRRPAAAGAA